MEILELNILRFLLFSKINYIFNKIHETPTIYYIVFFE